MRAPTRRSALCLIVALAAMRPVGADDQTHLIEFAPRMSILASAISASGAVVVGGSDSIGGLYWMPTTGAIFLGGLTAAGVSGDGTRIVGTALDRNGIQNAAIWLRGTEWRLLGSFANAVPCDRNLSTGTGVSRNGNVVVGIAWNGCTAAHAFRWEESTGVVDLGSSVDGRASQALGVSGDGRIVVGAQDEATGYRRGARWVDGRQVLFTGAGGPVGSSRAINRDGSMIGGRQCRPDIAADQSAWIWTESQGIVCLPAPGRMQAPVQIITEANALSDDGRVVGGRQGVASSPDQEAVIWINRSPAYLKDFLRSNGVANAFATWVNTGEITGVSPDGRVLVGYGAALGGFRGYMVILGSDLVMP